MESNEVIKLQQLVTVWLICYDISMVAYILMTYPVMRYLIRICQAIRKLLQENAHRHLVKQ